MHTLSQLRSGQLHGLTRLDLSEQLTSIPDEVLGLADTLEVLNLSGNALSDLPDWLAELPHLKVLFCSDNRFTALPDVLGACPALSMVGFKANRISQVGAHSLPPALRWLILTDNVIERLPDSLGQRPALEKVALAGNRLSTLPETMAQCDQLALLRLSANEFRQFPDWIWSLPSLSWLALAGNPATVDLEARAFNGEALPSLAWSSLTVHQCLGEGASGHIHRVSWETASGTHWGALKVFKGELTSDGWPRSEMAAALQAGEHPHLIGVRATLVGHPQGRQGLLMPLVPEGQQALARPPSLTTCSRDVYPADRQWDWREAWRMASEAASALQHLHARGLMHGDFYAHNLLWQPGQPLRLGDFGAATPFDPTDAQLARRMACIEVRAWGCFLQELLSRVQSGGVPQEAWWLQQACTGPVQARPDWRDIGRAWAQLAH